MTINDLKPRSTAVLRGDDRTLQYYCLRTGWIWTLSDKTRSTTEAMQEAWGHELDIVTLLGIEPKPVKRDWRRYDEARELVDAGRARKDANKILDALRAESHREELLRKSASFDLLDKFEEQFTSLVEKAEKQRASFAKRIVYVYTHPGDLGPSYDNLLRRCHHATRAEVLLKAIASERDHKQKGALLKKMRAQVDEIRESIMTGNWERSIANVDDAVCVAQIKIGREWVNWLVKEDYTEKHGWIPRYLAWQAAKEILAKRSMTDVADKLKMLGKLGRLG